MEAILELVLSWVTSFNWKMVFNYGFPAALCVYLLERYRKTLGELNNTIKNDLVHVIEKDSENTEKVEKSMDKMSNSMDNLTSEIKELIERK